ADRDRCALARTVADARERRLRLAAAEAAAARRQIGRLARLAMTLAAGAGPRAERRIGDVDALGAEVLRRVVEDQVVALRILPQLEALEAEHAVVLELGRNLIGDVVVGREAELVLALRRQVPLRHHE